MTPATNGTGDGRPHGERIEPIVWMLAALIIFFAVLMVGISRWAPNDGQTFQALVGLLTTFSGAFVMRVKPSGSLAQSQNPEGNGTALPEKEVK